MKKVIVAMLVIVLVALGAVSLVGCEKSLDGTYVDHESSARTIVIDGNTIKTYWTTDGKTEIDGEFTFTRDGDVLTTTSDKEWWKKLTITKDDNLTYQTKTAGGDDITVTYTKVKAK